MLNDLKKGYISDTKKVQDLGLRMWITGLTIALVIVFIMYIKEKDTNDSAWRERYNFRAAEVIVLQIKLDKKDSIIERKNIVIDSSMREQVRGRIDLNDDLYEKYKELDKLKSLNKTIIKRLKNGIKN